MGRRRSTFLFHAFCFFFLCGVQTQHAIASNWTPTASWNGEEASGAHRNIRKNDTRLGDPSPFSPGSHNIAVDMGQVFLMGDLTKYADTIGTQAHYTYGVSDLFSFDSSLGYSQHSSGKYSMLTILTGMRLNLAWYDKLVPYVIFGLGFYRPYYEDSTVPPIQNSGGGTSPASVSSLVFGIHLGPGIDLEVSKNVFFGAGLTFHNMFGTTASWGNGTPHSIGGSFTSFLLHIGLTF